MYQVGEKIVIKDNAFEGSDDPKDFEWRGKVAEVVVELGDNCYEVYVEGMGNCLLVAKEMRANKRLQSDASPQAVVKVEGD